MTKVQEVRAAMREEQLTNGLHLDLHFSVDEFQHDLDDERFTDEQVKNAAIAIIIGEEGDILGTAYVALLDQIRELLEKQEANSMTASA
jgi:hypothetical protein